MSELVDRASLPEELTVESVPKKALEALTLLSLGIDTVGPASAYGRPETTY